MLTPQFILRVAGIAALVVSALFVILAVHYYLTQDIRGVMDDLSGKARARGVGTSRRAGDAGGGAPKRAHRTSAAAPAAAPVRQGVVEEAPAAAQAAEAASLAMAFEEEGGGTVLVAAPSAMPAVEPVAARPTDAVAAFEITRSIVMIHSDEIIASDEELSA